MSTLIVSFLAVILTCLVVCAGLSALLREPTPREDGQIGRLAGLVNRWRFTPHSLGGSSYRSLFLVSVLGLFLELLLIRWVSSEIRVFAYFKNYVLIACFLGFGVGCYLCRRSIHLMPTVGALLFLVLLIVLPLKELRNVVDALPNLLGVMSGVRIWGLPTLPFSAKLLVGLIGAVGVVVTLFLVIGLAFVPIGQLVGWQLENAANGITGYTVNILGSLAGILLYTGLCFLMRGPVVWFALAGIVAAFVVWRVPLLRWTTLLGFGLCAVLASIDSTTGDTVYWSPYQKLALSPNHSDKGELISYQLTTNNSWYQQIIDLSDRFVAKHPACLRGVPIGVNAYNLPYRFHDRAESVLVLGAGMGNDAAAALRQGAERVVAVEIDPMIVSLGRSFHFEKPYTSPKVELIVDDARNYVENATEQFDMVVFSLLDSHTTSSHYSNVRTDNYVYTLEGLAAAGRLLEPDGVFVVKFQVETPWIAGRLQGLLTEVFGETPLQMQAEKSHTTEGRFFICGSKARIADALSDRAFADYVRRQGNIKVTQSRLTTDDWPYFYQQEPGIPTSVAIVSIVLVVIGILAIRRVGVRVQSTRWHFFYLGAAFLLIEVHIVSKMALLFGTTWVVNSIVIAAVLLMIVAANILAERFSRFPISIAYLGLFGSIGVSYALPPESLFVAPMSLRILVSGAVLCLPVFFAGIVFIRAFARVGFSGEALGSNLFGALVGGLLESLSFWIGIKALLLVAAVLYLASAMTIPRDDNEAAGEPAAVG